MTKDNSTPRPETSFEFIEEWFIKAKHESKRQGRLDSAKLWEDGIEHLRYYKDKAVNRDHVFEELVEALGKIANELEGYSDNTFGNNAYKIAMKSLSKASKLTEEKNRCINP